MRPTHRLAVSGLVVGVLYSCMGPPPTSSQDGVLPSVDFPGDPVELGLLAPVALPDAAYFEQAGLSPPDGVQVQTVYGAITRPVPGLTADQQAAFARGGDLFSHAFTPLEGLGPLANSNSCGTCHQAGGIGGPGHEVEHRMGLVNMNDPNWMISSAGFYPMPELGGPVQQGDAGTLGEALPAQDAVNTLVANLAAGGVVAGNNVITSARTTPIVAGDGLLSAIADSTLTARAALPRPFGISGRANTLTGSVGDLPLDGRVGHLGLKAQLPDNEAFIADASVQELGMSHPHNRIENVPDAPAREVARTDLTQQEVDDMLAFCAGLAPVKPYAVDMAGQTAFYKAGCAVCHYAGYSTQSQPAQLPPSLRLYGGALAGKPLPAYTDLLVHDMGRGLADGFAQGSASGSFWRTPPLWGLRYKTTFMHDGGSLTLDAAIQRHMGTGSEANQVIENYLGISTQNPGANLSETERAAVIAFLQKL